LIRYRAGCELKLPVSEARRLIEMGTVVEPGQLPLVGPHPDLVHPDRPRTPITRQIAALKSTPSATTAGRYWRALKWA